MRRITAALLLTSCLALGEIAQAQSHKPATEPQQEYTQQPVPRYDATDNQSKYNGKDSKQTKKQDEKKDKAAQSNCMPQPKAAGEGDPDAVQNQVEYRAGGG